MNKNKKGIQLNEAVMAVMTIMLVALLVIVSIVLFTSLNTTMDTDNVAVNVVNESLAKATSGGIYLTTGYGAKNGVCGAVTAIYNTTNHYPITVANISQTGCLVKNVTTETNWAELGATWKYSYPYTYSQETAASNSTNTTISQFGQYPALIGLVGTIIFLGLVIGVLVASFAFGGRKEGA
jgi:hypothetical protein